MLSFIPWVVIFPIHLALQLINLVLWSSLIIVLGILKLILPIAVITKLINQLLNCFTHAFGIGSVRLIKCFNSVELDYQIDGKLSQTNWYLIISNHLSWLDINLLIGLTAGKIPAPKFFLKKELIWLPFVGLGAWALDMPFMQRYSRQFIERNPHLKGKDIETTKKSCEKFRQSPTSVINFVEGNRYTPEKHKQRASKYVNLLPPKAGGIAFTLAAMGELFTNILDITIVYPNAQGSPALSMLAGKLKKVSIRIKVKPISQQVIGDYFNDPEFKQNFQLWLNQVWSEKDQLITDIKEKN
ncbi:acyltransferase [Paraglaciecola aquimarina]|uniref:Acyltransferase n=1 Tax=Paraglaciecola algarum TaxID=3050085 RepID=A0ABS9D3V6_9ALTE|nr:acyltransferase [Paraglaciecola sp. G1-23]MCF2947314.1 acyltransferase [Paraglaciecola sp. G1-23]